MQEKILVLDFGSQYSHLIVRRCREVKVYAEMMSCTTCISQLRAFDPCGVILSGGPSSVYDKGAPHVCKEFWAFAKQGEIPVLGICYGLQEMMHSLGGKVISSDSKEYGTADLLVKAQGSDIFDPLFQEIISNPTRVWMSHGDCVKTPAPGFEAIAVTANAEFAAVSFPERLLWGLQFHPEVTHTEGGLTIFHNFCVKICGAPGNWTMERFVHKEVSIIKEKVGDGHVLGALSGGVDSSVAAAMVHRAIGDKFHGFLVDTGLLRKREADYVLANLQRQGLRIDVINASDRFFSALDGVTDPEEKRKLIGGQFIEEFQSAARLMELPHDSFLLQGTLYPDVIESSSFKGPSHTIKTHHNVGGLPEKMNLKVLEPLRDLFKGECALSR
eukprot:GHVN01066732.1.p2 GENE.GHVN01066732.1~~GHVN01066732.1.p2  ORF type:complete len:386 (+),score=37.79 GHVN01066732.1:2847-4004(+)